ncbi:STAS-like domain-containing protein [Microbulbifer sp. CAU 1566]|uniref:STAS-like domain-containing protein n=1 Tax=Microbulbifer sp. CAU 1566 TaxID=2933269 RepID=UPI002005F0E8|nr:DUF4325 domain-containing protein [Microbulbifer sp. CAU 1566]MCK7596900.1 STAS-like domain-containing protein [Microbulbifer sp. CAU 1566]
MADLKISIAEDFSDAPGARYRDDGDASGQEFYEDHLKGKFEEAVAKKNRLIIDMDRTYGYATSFISASFGRLSKEFGADKVLSIVEIISKEDENVKRYTINIIKNPEKE